VSKSSPHEQLSQAAKQLLKRIAAPLEGERLDAEANIEELIELLRWDLVRLEGTLQQALVVLTEAGKVLVRA
jgi:hypothetical protein